MKIWESLNHLFLDPVAKIDRQIEKLQKEKNDLLEQDSISANAYRLAELTQHIVFLDKKRERILRSR